MIAWSLFAILTATGHQQIPECGDRIAMRERETFVACARSASDKYRDHDRAVLEGYRPIGGDFPAMGEHWIRVGLVFDGVIDPRRPEVLQYITVGGRKVLVGLAYATPLLAGEEPPDWPAGRQAWHDHTRSIEEETLRPHHHGAPGAATDARVAMLHVWTSITNPDGVFAADNWALAYARLGLDIPSSAPTEAAKALALVSGVTYFEDVIDTATEGSQTHHVRRIIRAAAGSASAHVSRRSGRRLLSASELDALAVVWRDMWTAIEALFSEEIRAHLRHSAIR
jgi:hypothetical protein